MVNKLSSETSPYLLQHAGNPVEWHPWGSEALRKAQQEEKPIFLSVGYSACHWCHVMAHESFEDDQIANFMNTHFVNIKVDREERPDLDAIYMHAVVAMTGQGGWPMSVFLTPAGEPFFAGTYFPPQRRYNLPSFMDVLESIAQVWSLDRNRVITSAQQISVQLQRLKSPTDAKSFEEKYLDNALSLLLQTYDSAFGGWGEAPKFPQPMAIEFLLQYAARGDKPSLEIAKHALESMSQGGIYDVIGGGFARYSTDAHWLVPHFEKMLYDNAQLARNYLHAYLITGDLSFGAICQETLAFIARELLDEKGGFFSSLDADSDGEEGKYYLWTLNEIQSVLTDPNDLALFLSTYKVSDRGNFDGKNILRRSARIVDLAEQFHLSIEEINNRLSTIHRSLRIFRDQRTRPATDDKILVAWNAMTLQTFAEAARYLSNPDYLLIAQKNAHFLMDNLYQGGRLFRSWRSGQAKHNAFLEDYASLIIAMLALYQSDSDNTWFEFAQVLAADMLKNFHDPAGGFFDVRDDQKDILYRPKNLQDNATPSGNALAAIALLMLSEYTARNEFRSASEKALIEIQSQASQYPLAFAKWLIALDFVHHPWTGIAILGDLSSSETQDLVQALWSAYRPHILAAISSYPPPASAPELLQNRPLLNNKSTAFVCQNFTCKKPVSSPTELLKQLQT